MNLLEPARKPVHRKPPFPIPLYVLSDSTGNLARHMVTSFLTQFPAGSFQVFTKPFVRQPQRMEECFHAVSTRPGIVFHAVVSPELKSEIAARCEALKVSCRDLTGSTVKFLARAAGIKPESDPHKLHPVDGAYCGRINALNFALEHDDGLGLDSLAEADVVLAGVSRTGKTPASMFLAMQGFRTANVALAMPLPPPRELVALPAGKVIGLVIHPANLAGIRTRRQTAWHMAQTAYSDPRQVEKEIQWSRRIFTELRCPVLDVTDQAVEETAARVIDMLGLTEPSGRLATEELS